MLHRAPLHLFFFILTVCLAFALGGCKAKASLDADVDHLLTAIATADYEHFKADAHPNLIQETTKAEFDEMVGSLKKLGTLTSKTMKGIETSSNKDLKTGVTSQVSKGNYALVFTNGKANLAIKSISGKVAGAHFSNVEFAKK